MGRFTVLGLCRRLRGLSDGMGKVVRDLRYDWWYRNAVVIELYVRGFRNAESLVKKGLESSSQVF